MSATVAERRCCCSEDRMCMPSEETRQFAEGTALSKPLRHTSRHRKMTGSTTAISPARANGR